MAQGALTIMERDLSGAFTSRDFGEYYQLSGTPYGFTMVGIAPGGGLQRTTWVVTDPDWLIPTAEPTEVITSVESPTTGDDIKAYTLVLLRFVDTDVEDLDSFYFYWDAAGNKIPTTWEEVRALGTPEGSETSDRFDELENFLSLGRGGDTAEEQSTLYSALKRELWIEMLRGAFRPDPASTDKPPPLLPAYPQFWADVDAATGDKVAGDYRPDYRDYVVAEMIANPEATGDEALVTRTDGPFFQYVRLLAEASGQEMTGFWSTVYNEDNYRAYDALATGLGDRAFGGYDGMLGDPLQPRLPDAVLVNLTFLRESPLVGAPDLWHRMKQMIDVPTAFTRSVP